MPAGQFDSVFVRGIEREPRWDLVFYNNKQKLFVDTQNEQAKALLAGVMTGDTYYPDEYHRNLMMARLLLSPKRPQSDAERRRGYELAIKAFEEHPSQTPMRAVLSAARFTKLRNEVVTYVRDYYNEFVETKDELAKKDGYHHRLVAALVAGNYLQNLARASKNTKLAATYAENRKQFSGETRQVVKTKRW
jgi:hypothetical protein